MSDFAIKAEGLGKKYLLRHQTEGRRYVALRDVLVEKTKALFTKRQASIENQKFEEFWALKDVAFEIKAGEAVGIIGRNGAGKSTLLKLLSRITEPSKGDIWLRGRVASLLEVGTGFHPELTGRENIFLNGAVLGMHRAEIKQKFDEIVAFAEVERFLDTPVKRYSSGMYMRLAFAVAAHLEPEILVVDEVLAVGDAEFQKKCLGKMQNISQQQGRTVLFVSHNLEAVLRLCSHAIWLDKGCLKKSGVPNDIVNEYLQQRHTLSGVVSLRDIPRTGWWLRRQAKLLELISPTFSDGSVWIYPFGEAFSFGCTLSLDKSFAQMSVGFAVLTMTGFEIASALVSLTTPTAGIEAGQYRVTIESPELRFSPGSFSLRIGVRSENGEEDFVDGAVCFDVATNDLAAAESADTILAAIIPKVRSTLRKLD